MSSVFSWQSYPLERLLAERFHISGGFHPGQREIIELLLQGKRVLAIQRTGWGKSLCYQAASLYFPHLTLVFSPLKALMRDQCKRCNEVYGIPAAMVSSEFSEEENRATLERAVTGKFKVIFIAPERLHNALWQTYVQKMRISMLVIDEAHCISTWGHDFRPDYRRIARLVKALPSNVPVLALTATTNRRVEEDILQQIGQEAGIIRGTLHRPNLYLHVVPLRDDLEKLSYIGEVLHHRTDTGLIYTATRSSAEMVSTFLRKLGHKAEFYHGGRDEALRREIELDWMINQYNVVCSTNALGMGIDKPDIRFIIHYHLPSSPIHYYQEMGRAGRDGETAWCILLYDPADIAIQEHLIRADKPDDTYYEQVLSLVRCNASCIEDILWLTGFSENTVRTILADLEDQHFLRYHPSDRTYTALQQTKPINFSAIDVIRQQKIQEMQSMVSYAQNETCLMEYLTAYLGDITGIACGNCGMCRKENFPFFLPSARIQTTAIDFLNEDYMPYIDKCSAKNRVVHESGWSLSYHGRSRIGKLVRASKYEYAGPFALSLVLRAVEVINARYPVHAIDGIVSVPPTKSGLLVETFAQQVASMIGKEYMPMLAKVRSTQEQKNMTNRLQKAENVKGAFCVRLPEIAAGRTLLLIDDIYDSGYMMREAAKTLMQAGARAVYPLTITRTTHSDNQ